MDILFKWQQQDTAALAKVRRFNERFRKPETEKQEEVVYGKVSKKPSLPAIYRRWSEAKIKTPRPGEIERALYPRKP